jgi:phosphate-selective porin OprO/OprP
MAGTAGAQTTTPAEKAPEPVGVFQGAGILIAQTPDERFKWWMDGRVQLDAAMYTNSDNTLANGMELRRGRFALNMVLWKTWAAQFDVDFADSAVGVKDAWIGYTGVRNSMIRLGHFREPFGMETLTSSRYISFVERSLIDNFSPDRRLGVALAHWENRWQASAGVFGPALEDSVDTIGQDQTKSMTARITALPFARGESLIHVGVAASNIEPKAPTNASLSDANRWRMRARPESHVNRGRFIDTGQIPNVDHASLYGVEAAGAFGPLSFQAEYNREKLRRTVTDLPEPMLDGYYAYVSWFPTGDHRPYDRTAGEFERVVPKSPRGALELLARYSNMDLNDAGASIKGGRERITTLGANYYFNPNVRMMVNYLFVVNDENAKGDRSYIVNDKFNVLQARFALMF